MNKFDLINELNNNSEASVRRNSALELIDMQAFDEESVKALVKGITDSDRGVRDVCSRALSEPNEGASLLYASLISPLICHQNIEIRNLAAELLIKIGEPSLAGIQIYFHHTNKDIRQFAIEITGKIGTNYIGGRAVNSQELNNEVLESDYGNTNEYQYSETELAIEPQSVINFLSLYQSLIELLKDDSENVRNAAIEALGNLRVIESIGILIDMYYEDNELRPTIIEALGKIGEQKSVDFLFHLMCTGEDIFIKTACIDALALCGNDIEICSTLMEELANTQKELQVILLKTIYAIANRINIDLELRDELRYIAYNALADEDIDFRFAGLVALGHSYNLNDIESLINEIVRRNEDTQQFIISNLLINSDSEVINEFFTEYFNQYQNREIEPGEFLSNITYIWDEVPIDNREISKSAINSFVKEYNLDYLADILEIIE